MHQILRKALVVSLAAALGVGVVALALSVGVATASSGGGNSMNAKSCQKNGWASLATRSGQSFASETACTSYAAQGGQLIKQTALVCLNGGWQTLGTTSSAAFTSEQACVDYIDGGGTPVSVTADISLAAVRSTQFAQDWTITASNTGPAAATVTVTAQCSAQLGLGVGNLGSWAQVPGTNVVYVSLNPIPSGGSLSFVISCSLFGTPAAGYAEVTASSQPDPDSTPNNGVTTEDDYVALPVPPSADISLTAVRDTFIPQDWTITVNNAGPAAATVTVTTFCSGAGHTTGFTTGWTGGAGVYTTANPIPSGGSSVSFAFGCAVSFGGTTPADGYVEVTASSLPDPDSTPNNGVTTEDDYVALPAVG